MRHWHFLRRVVLSHPAVCLLALAPLLAILPPVPIDETRYLSIAWEMHQSGDWIHLHLNGAAYIDKPPLLFWMINLGWGVWGVSLWAARLVVLLFGAASVELCGRIERQLSPTALPRSPWLLLGTFFFVLFALVAMFDVVLCFFVLLGFLGAVIYVREGSAAALAMVLAASSLGMLTKGPVLLLHLAGPILLAWWWSPTSPRPVRRTLILLAAALLGGLPVLLWAWLDLHQLGPELTRELLLKETTGRVVESFAHDRPLWWYLPLVPLIVLPWPLLLRWKRLFSTGRDWLGDPAARFGLAACVPALLGFSFISGKQIHYLLPLLPGAALLLGAMIRCHPDILAIRRLLALTGLLGGLALWSLARFGWHLAGSSTGATALAYLGCISFCVLAGWLGWSTRRSPNPWYAAAGVLLLVAASLLLLRVDVMEKLDVRALAQRVAGLHDAGVELARVPAEPGLVTFIARLDQPLPTTTDPAGWARHHPGGYVLSYSGHGRFPEGLEDGVMLNSGWVGLMPSRVINEHTASKPQGVRGDQGQPAGRTL